MAARGARAAAGDAGDRVSRPADRPTRSRIVCAHFARLEEIGYVEGENVAIEYRWAEDQFDRLPALAADLVRRQVAVIAAPGHAAAFAAKAATTTIPDRLRRPRRPSQARSCRQPRPAGRQRDRFNFFSAELTAKRLELLRELVPASRLVWPCWSIRPMPRLRDHVERRGSGGARHSGCKFRSSTPAPAARSMRPSRHSCASGPTRSSSASTPSSTAGVSNWSLWRRATRSPRPMRAREFAEAGGLMSYGTNLADAFRQVGVYAGRILKGAKPADLPVVQSTKFELVINAETARMLGLDVPPTLLARADEVIE